MALGFPFQKQDKDNLLKEALYLAHDCARDTQTTVSHKSQNILAVAGLKEKRKAGQGAMFWQFRPYEVGDTPKNIDWKRTARGDSVVVRDRAEEQAETYRFWIDPSLRTQNHKHRDSLLYTLALEALLHEQEDKTAPISKGKITAKRGLKSLHENMTYFQSVGQVTLEGLKKVSFPKSHSCLLFSDFWQSFEYLEDNLKPLLRTHSHGLLVQIADAEELAFPFVGRTFFKDFNDDESTFRIEDAAAVKQAYLERIHKHQNVLKALAKRHGWRFVILDNSKSQLKNLKKLYDDVLHLEEKAR